MYLNKKMELKKTCHYQQASLYASDEDQVSSSDLDMPIELSFEINQVNI